MDMRLYVTKRALLAVPLILLVITINWLFIYFAPGDQVSYLVSGMEWLDPALIDNLRREYGLDRPFYEQYYIYMSKLLSGDFGYSLLLRMDVSEVLKEHLGPTLLLTMTAFVIELILGVMMGIISAKEPYSTKDNTISSVSIILWSMPYFWMGILGIMVFSLWLELFPVTGMSIPMWEGQRVVGLSKVFSVLWHLFMPAMILGAGHFAIYSRFVRASLLEVMRKDYILTARSKGLTENEVVYEHALTNSLLPVVTIIAIRLPLLFTGSILVETVFAWPGLGRAMYTAILRQDIQVLMLIFFVYASLTVVANLIADVSYAFLDPRIRYD
jgi:peptide/nickel transport system permease protein